MTKPQTNNFKRVFEQMRLTNNINYNNSTLKKYSPIV